MCHYIVSTLQSLYGPLFQRRICPWPPASPPPPPATTRPPSTAGSLLCPNTKWPSSDAVKSLRRFVASSIMYTFQRRGAARGARLPRPGAVHGVRAELRGAGGPRVHPLPRPRQHRGPQRRPAQPRLGHRPRPGDTVQYSTVQYSTIQRAGYLCSGSRHYLCYYVMFHCCGGSPSLECSVLYTVCCMFQNYFKIQI